MFRSKKHIVKASLLLVLVALILVIPLSTALAANPPGAPGQPNQSCEDQTMRPGNASSAPGSAFNPDGVAGTVYAGEQLQNSNNSHSVSQYDVACFQVSPH